MDAELLPVPAASVWDVAEQSAAKRARTDFFPRCFLCLVISEGAARITGLMHVTSVREYKDSADATPQYLNSIALGGSIDKSIYVVWALDSVIALQDGPMALPIDPTIVVGNLRRGLVLKALTQLGYDQLTQRKILIGGASMKLSEFVSKSFRLRCFRMTEEAWQQIASSGSRSLVTTTSHLYHAGLSQCDVVSESQYTNYFVRSTSSSADIAAETAPPINVDEDDDASSSDSDDGIGTGIESKSKPWHSFDVITNCARLSVLLRNAWHLKQAISASLAVFKAGTRHHESACLHDGINLDAMRVPGRTSIDRGWIRLDCMATLYERAQNAAGIQCFRSLMADSSQKLWNYFCVREKRTEIQLVSKPSELKVPSDKSLSIVACDAKAEEQSWDVMKLGTSSFAWQLSVLGHGAANIVYKFRNLLHGMLLRTSNDQELAAYRYSVIGWTSDQGTEYKLADICFAHAPNREGLQKAARDIVNYEAFLQPSSGPQNHWLFPWCLSMVGHLHLISNGLESAVTKTRIWSGYVKNGIAGLLTFLNSKALRQRFQAVCLPKAEWSSCDSFGKQLLDWRWESLGELLEQLMPLIPILQKRFDLQRLQSGHHSALSDIDASVLKVSSAFLKLDWLEAFLEMLRILSVTTNEFIGWLEGCPCHSHIWLMRGKSWKEKQAMFYAETGLHSCLFKGCRGSEMASWAADHWLAKVCDGTSSHLTRLLSRCSDGKRTGILAVQQDLQESVREEYQAKLLHWHHLPHSLLGMLDPERRRGKDVGRRCLNELEQADRSKMHRVCHRFFSDSVVMQQLRDFASGDARIQEFPQLHNLLVMYNSIPLVERSIEGEHAKIEKAHI